MKILTEYNSKTHLLYIDENNTIIHRNIYKIGYKDSNEVVYFHKTGYYVLSEDDDYFITFDINDGFITDAAILRMIELLRNRIDNRETIKNTILNIIYSECKVTSITGYYPFQLINIEDFIRVLFLEETYNKLTFDYKNRKNDGKFSYLSICVTGEERFNFLFN